jgi:GAF domain-containing protein
MRSLRKGKPPLQKQNEALKREIREAREQQAATAEVLKVISSSAGELEPVFNAVLEKATHICEAKFGILFRYEGNETFTTSALFNAPPALTEARRRESLFRPAANTAIGRMRLTKRPIHIVDMLAEPGYFDPPPGYSKPKIATLANARTVVAVPMLKDNELVGAVVIYRQEVRSFTNEQMSWCRTSPRKPSSRSRTPDCLMNCASALTISARHWNSRPRLLRC